MKKIYIHANLTEERYIAKVLKAISALKKKGYECIINQVDGFILYGDKYKSSGKINDCDLIVSLGGDGTFLRGCKVAVENDLPICGINCGNLGFLCACQLNDIDSLDLEALKMKELSLLQFEYGGNTYNALNEVVVGKDYFGGTVELEYECDEAKGRFKGDGLIICSATGSTAYNLSAGGRIFKEEDDLIGITPICAHTKDTKPVCVDNSQIIKVRLAYKKYSASIYADGNLIGPLDEISIGLSKHKVKVLNNR